MFTFLTKSIFLALLVLAPSAVLSKAVTMQCTLKVQKRGWIAEQIFVEYDEEGDAARVVDAVILHFEKRAKIAEITEDSVKKLVINWRVDTRVSNQTTKMAYRLAFFKSNNKVLVQAHPHGFVNNYTGRGKCQPTNQPLPTG